MTGLHHSPSLSLEVQRRVFWSKTQAEFIPDDLEGFRLLVHEATHVKQQAQGIVPAGVDSNQSLEIEAQQTAARVNAVPASLGFQFGMSRGGKAFDNAPSTKPRASQRFRATHATARAIQRQADQDAQETPIGKRAFVREDGLHLREKPDQQSKDLGTFSFGTRVFVVAQTGQWYKVMTASGKSGYMFGAQIHGLQPQHQAMLEKDPGLRLFRVQDGETGMGLVHRAYGINGAEGSKDQNLWHFLNVIRKNNQASAFGFKDKGWGDAAQNFFIPGADANNVMLKAKVDLWIPSFTIAAKDNSVGSGTVRGEIVRLGKNIEQKVKDFQAAQTYAKAAIGPIFAKRLEQGAHELIEGLITTLIAAAVLLVATTAIGAIIGAFAGGVGAAPGAALGFEVGMWLLEWLGLGFLVAWGVGKLAQVFGALGTFVSKVWNANGDQKQLQEAGVALADSLAILAVTALQILVTIGIAKGLGAATRGLANSKFGKAIGIPKLTAYLKGKIEGISNTAGSTPKTAKVQEGLQSTTPKAVVEKITGKPPKGFKSTPQELEALKAGKETVEVYTVGEIPKGGAQRWLALEEPKNWTPARQALHNELLSKAKLQSKAFAEAAKGEPPTIYAMRGNTAAGKSRAVKGNIPELEAPVNATPNMPHRAVNPDNFKADLYKAQPEVSLTSTQVHSESSTLASMLQKELVNMKTSDGKMGSMLIDKRLASVADVQDYAALAKSTGRKLNVYDVDAPLEVSLAGVLERVPGGADPVPPFQIVADGFTAVRINRMAVVEFFENNPNLGKYELFGTKTNGAKVKIAEIVNGQRKVFDQQLFSEVTASPGDYSKILAKKQITSEAIGNLVQNLPSERAKTVRSILEPYIGKTWEQALNEHSQAKK
jgi:Bacterial SH3 domain/Zeta toxin